MFEKDGPLSASRQESVDSKQRSKDNITEASEKDVPSGLEKEVVATPQDVEKQSQDQLPPQESASPTSTEEQDRSIVEFDGPDDPDNPKNWTARRRAIITIAMGLMTFVVTFSSSIFAVAIEPVAEEFDVGIPVATLGVSFFLLVSHRPLESILDRY